MRYLQTLHDVVLIKRYKRFLADIRWPDGTIETVHCPNTGAMTGCAVPDSAARISISDNPKRKYRATLEQTLTPDGIWIGVNPILANKLIAEAVGLNIFDCLAGWDVARAEVKSGDSRFDLLLKRNGSESDDGFMVEVKSVTLADNGIARFPDAKSIRGTKHLRGLSKIAQDGNKAAMIYCIQRDDVEQVTAAKEVDPDYAKAMYEASQAGVLMLAACCEMDASHIIVNKVVPVAVKL